MTSTPTRQPSLFHVLFGNKEKQKYTVATLKRVHGFLQSQSRVTDANRIDVIENMRVLSELMVWGDRNNSAFFEFFLEHNMLALIMVFVGQETETGVQQQVIQTLSIMLQNMNDNTAIFYLLSNNYINDLIVYRFRFDDELLAHYVSFLKTIALRLDDKTIQFFFDKERGVFPLYTQAIRFFDHSENMVRIAVRTLCLTIYRIADKGVLDFVLEPSRALYFNYLVRDAAMGIVKLHHTLMFCDKKELYERMDTAMEDSLDQLYYLRDVVDVTPHETNSPIVPTSSSMSSSFPSASPPPSPPGSPSTCRVSSLRNTIPSLVCRHMIHWLAVRLMAPSLLQLSPTPNPIPSINPGFADSDCSTVHSAVFNQSQSSDLNTSLDFTTSPPRIASATVRQKRSLSEDSHQDLVVCVTVGVSTLIQLVTLFGDAQSSLMPALVRLLQCPMPVLVRVIVSHRHSPAYTMQSLMSPVSPVLPPPSGLISSNDSCLNLVDAFVESLLNTSSYPDTDASAHPSLAGLDTTAASSPSQAASLLHVLVELLYSRDDTVVLGALVAWYSLLSSPSISTSSLLLNAPLVTVSMPVPAQSTAPPPPPTCLDLFDLLLDAVLHVVSKPYAVRLVTLQAAVDVLGVLVRWSSNTTTATDDTQHQQQQQSQSQSQPHQQQIHEARQRDVEWALRGASDGLVQMIKQASQGAGGEVRLFSCDCFMRDAMELPANRPSPLTIAHRPDLLLPGSLTATPSAAATAVPGPAPAKPLNFNLLSFRLPTSLTQFIEHAIHAYVVLVHARNRILGANISLARSLASVSTTVGKPEGAAVDWSHQLQLQQGGEFELRAFDWIPCVLASSTGAAVGVTSAHSTPLHLQNQHPLASSQQGSGHGHAHSSAPRLMVLHPFLWVLGMPHPSNPKTDTSPLGAAVPAIKRGIVVLSLPVLCAWCETDIGDARKLHFRISSITPPPSQLGVTATIITSSLSPSSLQPSSQPSSQNPSSASATRSRSLSSSASLPDKLRSLSIDGVSDELVSEDIYQFQLSFVFDDTASCLRVKRHVDWCRHHVQSTVMTRLNAFLGSDL